MKKLNLEEMFREYWKTTKIRQHLPFQGLEAKMIFHDTICLFIESLACAEADTMHEVIETCRDSLQQIESFQKEISLMEDKIRQYVFHAKLEEEFLKTKKTTKSKKQKKEKTQ